MIYTRRNLVAYWSSLSIDGHFHTVSVHSSEKGNWYLYSGQSVHLSTEEPIFRDRNSFILEIVAKQCFLQSLPNSTISHRHKTYLDFFHAESSHLLQQWWTLQSQIVYLVHLLYIERTRKRRFYGRHDLENVREKQWTSVPAGFQPSTDVHISLRMITDTTRSVLMILSIKVRCTYQQTKLSSTLRPNLVCRSK